MKLYYLLNLSILKTIRFNFHYFGLKSIFKPKVIIARNVKLMKLKGKVTYNNFSKTSAIGFAYNIVNYGSKNKTIFYNEGTIVFNGHFCVSKGCAVQCEKNARLEFGNQFHISQLSKIACYKNIKFEDNVTISWNCLFMDSDTHKLYKDNKIINSDENILIENNVWVCCNSFITKGAVIPTGGYSF